MKKVVVFGVFDLLHPGHLYFLKQAKKYGDHLTVVVTRNARMLAEKKRKPEPVFNERERLAIVQALRMVDQAVLGDQTGQWSVLKRLRPDVVCIGYDQKAEWFKKCGLKKLPRIARIKGWRTKKYQSSLLRN